MITIEQARVAIANSGLRPTHKAMLWLLLANCEEGESWPISRDWLSIDDMTLMIGWTQGTISQYLRALELQGWIERESCGYFTDAVRLYYVITPPDEAINGPVQYIRREPSKARKEAVKARDGYRCVLCGALDDLTVDHVQPLRFGGTNDVGNLQTLCRSCNSSKGLRV